MEDEVEIAEFIGIESLEEVVSFQVVFELEWYHVAPFLIGTESISNDNFVGSHLIECPHECASNESCSAGYEGSAWQAIKHAKGCKWEGRIAGC